MNAWKKNRGITRRLLVKGDLVLESPAHFGGDSNSLTDMPVLLDPLENRALLPGSSLAGALRAYLRQRDVGYRRQSLSNSLDRQMFDGMTDGEGDQSYLIIHNALARGGKPGMELRDGVMIDPSTRTAEDEKKFDFELLQAGLVFPLQFELLLTRENQHALVEAFCIALQGFERGEIALGARKHRGFGKCSVKNWQVADFDLSRPAELGAWLKRDERAYKSATSMSSFLQYNGNRDARELLEISGKFLLSTPLLIRSTSAKPISPDAVHLRSTRDGKNTPIISGTSIAGVLRGHTLRIANTLQISDSTGLVEGIFGPKLEKGVNNARASRIWVDETVIARHQDAGWVQNRVKIDRFTGGSYTTALFDEQPYFPDSDEVSLSFRFEDPQPREIGLLLLALKDMWLSDLPLGGESSVGRGRLAGKNLKIRWQRPAQVQEWEIRITENGKIKVTGSEVDALEAFVTALRGGQHE